MTTSTVPELPSGLLIGSEWLHATSGGELEHVNPATGKVQQTFPVAGPPEVDAAVATARKALPVWRALSPSDRRDALRRLAGLLRERSAEFARIGTLETGLLSTTAATLSHFAADWFDYYAGWADKLQGDLIPMPGAFDYTLPEPIGVAAVLVGWNGPLGGIGMTCAAPLAAGCTVVMKAPELSPFSSSLLGQLCLDAGLPPGVMNVIAGGPETGDALVRHPDIDKISFTGSRAIAKLVQAAAAESVTPLVLELGGKSANIVFADADLDRAAAASVAGASMMNGQTCVSPTRLLVHEAIYDELIDRVAKMMDRMAVGDPADPATAMGPVISSTARDRIMSMIERTASGGTAQLVAGGERVGGELAGGFFVRPTLFGDVDNGSELAQNEIFGPVLAAIRFSDEDEAVSIANDVKFGLAAYLHTNDLGRAHRVAAALEAGNIAINGGSASAGPYAPFGGFAHSGYGKEGGLAGLLEFVRIKNVNISVQ